MEFLWASPVGKYFMTILVSMVPVIELRGAIPLATYNGLSLWTAIPLAVIGNMIPVPFILLFIRHIFAWLRKRSARLAALVARMEKKADKHKEKVLRYEFWGLFILVAIPLPGTGAWTGALVAAMLDMRMKRAFPAILLGVIGAGVIVAVVTLLGKTVLAV